MIQEEWRPVVGFEGAYEVSNHGRVRSLDRYIWRRPSRRHPDPRGWYQFRKGKILRPCPTSTGHLVVNLGIGSQKKMKMHLLHRIILEAFEGPCPERHEGLHDDDIPSNNALPNLRWGTRGENVKDAIKNGRRSKFWGINQARNA